jgi:hypothetical protein
MIIYLKDPKTPPKKKTDMISTFGTEAGYKMNIQKSVVFLYTNNEQTEKEIRKSIPFTIA